MAKQVFAGSPLNYSYIVIDNSAASNFGDQNAVNPPSSSVVPGAGGYDNTTGTGAAFQAASFVSAGNNSIPDFAVSPTKVLTNAASATITYKNPA